jgi:hypothetical protein
MTVLRKHAFTILAAGLLSISSGTWSVASADEVVVVPEAATEAPAVTSPSTPEATGDTAAVAPEGTDETATEVAPSSSAGTAEEPSFSDMPSEGPGGGCHGRRVEDPSV